MNTLTAFEIISGETLSNHTGDAQDRHSRIEALAEIASALGYPDEAEALRRKAGRLYEADQFELQFRELLEQRTGGVPA